MLRAVRRAFLAGRLVAAAVALVLAGAPAGAFADAGLGPAQVGVTLHAPAAPAVGGGAPATVSWTWRRCRRYRDQVGADGPSAYWTLGDSPADLAGHASLTPVGAPGTAGDGALVGEQDPAATFDGTGAAFTAPSPVDVTGVNPYTLEVWVRPRLIDGRTRYLMALESSTAGAARQGTGIWLSSSGLGFERVTDGQASTIVYRAGLPVGQWSYVVTSYDGGVMRLFVNGQQVGSRVTDTPLGGEGDTVSLAATDGGQAGFFAGDLDEAALYDHAVIRSHVAVHRQAATSDPCSAITAATGPNYAPTYADLDATLEVTVTATAGGDTQSVTAATTGVVVDASGQAVHLTLDAISAGQTVTGNVPINVTVTGAVPDRIEFDIDGHLRYEKVGEPPYQYTWYTAADANGHHTITVQAYARRSSTPAAVSALVTVSNATIFPPMLPFGKESMYSEFNQGDSASANAAAVADNLLDNVWPARGFPLVRLGWPLTWTEDPYNDAFWRFYQYSLRPESSLLYMWKTTGDQRYLDKLIAILRSYVAYDQTRPVNTLTFDNNHTAAYRAMTLTNFYFKLRDAGVLPPDLDAGLQASLARIGAFLADPRHFEGGYNHGYNEGAALLLIADNFPQLPNAATWRQTAIDRLDGMLTATLDSDGVEVENSPFYHVYVLGLVYQIAQWAKLYEPALATPYSDAAQRMLRYAAYVTQPSGYLPMLGATATTYMPSQDPSIYGPMAAADPAFRFAYTRGAQGTPPPDGVVLFPASGLFVLRSVLGTPANLPQQTYVTFQAGPYRTEHSNLDALGMTMYAAGQTVLPTSGLFTYTQQPDRTYFHGTSAHNTVVVDGGDQAEGTAHAGPHGDIGASSYATGTSDLYAGVHHRRSVVVLRQGLSLVVDQLRGGATHSYTQTWHLDPSAVLDQSGQDAFVSGASGNRYLTIRQADPAGETLTALKGQTSPLMAGWYSSAYGHKVPSYQLQYTRTGTSAQFTTLLAAGPYATQTGTVTDHQVGGGTEVDVCVGGTVGYVVTLPADETAPLTVTGGACPAAAPPAGAPDPARAALAAPTLALSAADQKAFAPLPARSGAIPVLLFHSVCVTACTSYNVTPQELARVLLMLRAAGFQTVSIGDYVRWQHGEPVSLPARPVLITFDDARLDAFRGADQLLAGLGDRATMFNIVANTESGDPHYLRWDELARMEASGRWQVQLHAGYGHVMIPTGVDASGHATTGPYYAWRRYDPVRYPSGDHLEPYADWQLRAEGDIAQAEALMAAHLPGHQALAFSVPFGDYGQYHSNDSRIAPELARFLHSRYGVSFVQPHADPDFTTPGHEADRYTIRSATTADEVYAWLAEHSHT